MFILLNTQEKYIKTNTINMRENHLRIYNFQVNHKNGKLHTLYNYLFGAYSTVTYLLPRDLTMIL